MSIEFKWLAYTVLLTALLWVPYVLNRMVVRGVWGTLQNPVPDEPALAAWALRAKAAHNNAVINLAIFAPLVLMLGVTGESTGLSVLACQLYFWARLLHYLVYAMGIPVARTLTFVAGWAAQLMLLWVLLG